MHPGHLADSEPASVKRLKILMLARVLIVTLLLGALALIQIGKEDNLLITPNNALYIPIGFTYLLTIIYALALKRIRDVNRFAYGQILFDTVFVTILVYLTGGIESLFPLAYILAIIGAGLALSKHGAYVIASTSGMLYSGCLVLEYHGVIEPFTASGSYYYTSQDVLYRIFIYLVAFVVVAALVSHLGEELRTKKKELRQKQLDYEKLEAFHENIIQSLDSGLITTDLHGSISFLNKTACRILGFDPSSDVSLDLDRLLSTMKTPPPPGRGKREEISRREETTFRRPDGKVIHLGLSKSPLRDNNGTLVGTILIFQNITRIKEMEEQIKRSDRMVSIGHMAAGIAHEIRNPLASLTGSIQVLKEEMNLSDSNVSLMNIIMRESERLNKLVTDFLLFAQPPRIEFGPVMLNQLIDETLQVLQNSPRVNGHISISKKLTHEGRVLGNADQLKQVLWNLFLNAVQEMEGGGQLGLKLEHEGPRVKLTVSDTGKGIGSQEIGKIFEPFFTTRESGTGLGLAIVHRIVETHGGEIRVDSQTGKGTSFTLLLPELDRC